MLFSRLYVGVTSSDPNSYLVWLGIRHDPEKGRTGFPQVRICSMGVPNKSRDRKGEGRCSPQSTFEPGPTSDKSRGNTMLPLVSI